MAKDMQLVDVTPDLAKKIVVHRVKDGGFQRKLKVGRMPGIIKALADEEGHCPPISVAIVGGKHLLIDGQHRFAAWQLRPFPLKATVVRMADEDEATEAFISLNREQQKVSLTHILTVSNQDYAVRVRRMAEECKVTIQHINNLMMGIVNCKNPLKADITDAHWALAAKTLAFWMRSKRWGAPGNVYSTLGVLKLVGYYVGISKGVDSTLRDLQNLEYSVTGPIGRIAGTSFSQQGKMKAVFNKYMTERMLR